MKDPFTVERPKAVFLLLFFFVMLVLFLLMCCSVKSFHDIRTIPVIGALKRPSITEI